MHDSKWLLKSMNYLYKFILIFFISIFLLVRPVVSENKNEDFNEWLISYKKMALKKGISKDTLEKTFKNVKYLENVIKYDRKQPEFFEDTLTYVSKRATKSRAKKAKALLNKNKKLFQQVENKFNVEKEILLSLWGIETNFGRHVGKMDIVSSLATLSYDKRRREFFSSQLLILLKLIDKKLIDPETLYGSWAGAYGNFQFMPSSIERYAIDYDKNNKIELKKSLDDALASAANYINEIGWKKETPCFYKVELKKDIKKEFINFSAKKIKNRLKISQWKKKGVVINEPIDLSDNYKAGLIMPDGKPGTPTYLVFSNYEKILKWNRSLRFAISVCTLADMIKK
tara:strand:+ start:822 stop:1847 length:1026 start_codon:yes stop_codon:yes gene_type:complete